MNDEEGWGEQDDEDRLRWQDKQARSSRTSEVVLSLAILVKASKSGQSDFCNYLPMSYSLVKKRNPVDDRLLKALGEVLVAIRVLDPFPLLLLDEERQKQDKKGSQIASVFNFRVKGRNMDEMDPSKRSNVPPDRGSPLPPPKPIIEIESTVVVKRVVKELENFSPGTPSPTSPSMSYLTAQLLDPAPFRSQALSGISSKKPVSSSPVQTSHIPSSATTPKPTPQRPPRMPVPFLALPNSNADVGSKDSRALQRDRGDYVPSPNIEIVPKVVFDRPPTPGRKDSADSHIQQSNPDPSLSGIVVRDDAHKRPRTSSGSGSGVFSNLLSPRGGGDVGAYKKEFRDSFDELEIRFVEMRIEDSKLQERNGVEEHKRIPILPCLTPLLTHRYLYEWISTVKPGALQAGQTVASLDSRTLKSLLETRGVPILEIIRERVDAAIKAAVAFVPKNSGMPELAEEWRRDRVITPLLEFNNFKSTLNAFVDAYKKLDKHTDTAKNIALAAIGGKEVLQILERLAKGSMVRSSSELHPADTAADLLDLGNRKYRWTKGIDFLVEMDSEQVIRCIATDQAMVVGDVIIEAVDGTKTTIFAEDYGQGDSFKGKDAVISDILSVLKEATCNQIPTHYILNAMSNNGFGPAGVIFKSIMPCYDLGYVSAGAPGRTCHVKIFSATAYQVTFARSEMMRFLQKNGTPVDIAREQMEWVLQVDLEQKTVTGDFQLVLIPEDWVPHEERQRIVLYWRVSSDKYLASQGQM